MYKFGQQNAKHFALSVLIPPHDQEAAMSRPVLLRITHTKGAS